MSSKETKSEEPKQPPVDRVAATYAATEKSLADIENKASVARREIREQAEGYARVQEERQRQSEQWNYEEEQRRRAVLDRQKEEDRERDRRIAQREADLVAKEKLFVETTAELFGPVGNPFDPKQAKQSLDKKISDAEKKGFEMAKREAERDYATKKAIDEATAAKDLALLKSDNERLKADNAKLEAENKRLSEVNTNLATRTGDLALGAFNASAGIQSKATESLQAAAQSGQRLPNR
jgi:hypothetical protein